MWNGFKVIDSDAHHHEPRDIWERYVAPAFKDRVPKVVGMRRNLFIYADQNLQPEIDRSAQRAASESEEQYMAEKYGEAWTEWWSPEIRLKDMDRYGWDIQVILSTNANRIMEIACKHPDVGLAMARGYHDWCHEYSSADPKRLKFTATLPAGDTPTMLEEARRAVADLGAVSARNPLLPEGKWLHLPEYEPLWQLASDLDFPISLHGESRHRRADPFRNMPRDEGRFAAGPTHDNAFAAMNTVLAFPIDNMINLCHYVFTGILDRFPKLRLAILESNVGWAPFFLARMDDHTRGRRLIQGYPLPMLPSEYVKRQCVIAADCDEPDLDKIIDFMGDENIVWNTDYRRDVAPDPDKVMPWFAEQPVSDESKRKILWDNAIRLYGSRLLAATP